MCPGVALPDLPQMVGADADRRVYGLALVPAPGDAGCTSLHLHEAVADVSIATADNRRTRPPVRRMVVNMELTDCPQCGLSAEIEWRAVLASTDGPIEHARIRCVDRRWLILPVASLENAPSTRTAYASTSMDASQGQALA